MLLTFKPALPMFCTTTVRVAVVPRGTVPKSSEPLTLMFGCPMLADPVMVFVSCPTRSVSTISVGASGPTCVVDALGENVTSIKICEPLGTVPQRAEDGETLKKFDG